MANIKAYHPGTYIKDALDVMKMSAAEFSLRTGISERTLSAVINEKGNITFDIAAKLSDYFGSSIDYWTNLQNAYDVYQRQNEIDMQLQEDLRLAKTYGLKKYMQELGVLKEDAKFIDCVEQARKYAGVNRLSFLNRADSLASFKQMNGQRENDAFAQNFWIALALSEARKEGSGPYNKAALLASMDKIRSLTVLDPSEFYPALKEILDGCGISFVLLPHLSKSNIYGATKWFDKDHVMLALSNRVKRADLFWFTLFHEIAHVLMEHRREALYQIKGIEDAEADRMAADMLIPRKEWDAFIRKGDFGKSAIETFAKSLHILPVIVLGRLQKEKRVPQNAYNTAFNVSYEIAMGR